MNFGLTSNISSFHGPKFTENFGAKNLNFSVFGQIWRGFLVFRILKDFPNNIAFASQLLDSNSHRSMIWPVQCHFGGPCLDTVVSHKMHTSTSHLSTKFLYLTSGAYCSRTFQIPHPQIPGNSQATTSLYTFLRSFSIDHSHHILDPPTPTHF